MSDIDRVFIVVLFAITWGGLGAIATLLGKIAKALGVL